MYRMNFVCCATNHSQESANSPHFCLFVQTWPKKEVVALVVDNGGGTCKADFASDAPCVSAKAVLVVFLNSDAVF